MFVIQVALRRHLNKSLVDLRLGKNEREGRCREEGRREEREREFCRPSVLKEDSQPEIFYSSVTSVLHLSCVL